MKTQVVATYSGGVLKPDEALPLAEDARVRITVEPVEEPVEEPNESLRALQSLIAFLEEHPVHAGDLHYTRDELYERR